MTTLTVSGYRVFIRVSIEALLERDAKAAHRITDEYSEVIRCVSQGEVYRRIGQHSLTEMLNWLEQDLYEELNRVAPEGSSWRVVNGSPMFV